MYNELLTTLFENDLFNTWIKESTVGDNFSIENSRVSVEFNSFGLLKSITLKNTGENFPLNLTFARYLFFQELYLIF